MKVDPGKSEGEKLAKRLSQERAEEKRLQERKGASFITWEEVDNL